jgi:nanoRNase/pAp phosphatase (c-di-AMP/oligoRNAs hydrolase)
LVSRLGNLLAQKSQQAGLRGAAAIIYEEPKMSNADSKYKISLRSLQDEDVSVVAKQFGGGGHKNAASFIIEKKAFELWLNGL